MCENKGYVPGLEQELFNGPVPHGEQQLRDENKRWVHNWIYDPTGEPVPEVRDEPAKKRYVGKPYGCRMYSIGSIEDGKDISGRFTTSDGITYRIYPAPKPEKIGPLPR